MSINTHSCAVEHENRTTTREANGYLGVDFVVKVLEHRACTMRYLSIETDTDDESMLRSLESE